MSEYLIYISINFINFKINNYIIFYKTQTNNLLKKISLSVRLPSFRAHELRAMKIRRRALQLLDF